MAVGDVFEVTTRYSWLSQVCINTYFYAISEQSGPPVPLAQTLADGWWIRFWGTALFGFRTSLFSDGLRGDIISVRALFNPDDFHERLEGAILGTNPGSDMPPFNAYGLRTSRTSGIIRRGFKRLPGILEEAQTAGVLLAGPLGQLQTLADDMTLEITFSSEGSEVTYSPVVVGRVKEVDPVTGKVTYRLPENAGEAFYTQIMQWEALPNVTSQATRKFGRGF